MSTISWWFLGLYGSSQVLRPPQLAQTCPALRSRLSITARSGSFFGRYGSLKQTTRAMV